MAKNKADGDIIHIYHMFGEPNYRGVVKFIDDAWEVSRNG